MTTYRTLIILQPTPFCNIDCEYCYLPNRSSTHKMDLNVFGKIALEVFSSKLVKHPVDFLWHLGEPLVIPIEYYEKAFSILREISQDTGINYSLGFQTNGLLLNSKWIKLIKDNKINIGVSLDGPDFIHNYQRVDKKKKGTHAKVMKGIKLLQEAEIPFSTIVVISKYSLNFPDEICDFFMANNINEIGFNIDELEGINNSTSFSSVEMIKYRQFIKRLLERSFESNGKFKVREFWLNIKPFTTEFKETYNTTNTNFGIFNFDSYGNFSTFCPELLSANNDEYNNFRMGNIMTDGLDSIEKNSIFLKVQKEINEGIELCKNSCEYWSFCGGGSPSNKFYENGKFDTTETLMCKFQKKEVIDLLANHFEKFLM